LEAIEIVYSVSAVNLNYTSYRPVVKESFPISKGLSSFSLTVDQIGI
jgi:hypothetical protein